MMDTELEMKESDIQHMSIEQQKYIHSENLDRETLMRDQLGVNEGYGRESYNLANLIQSNKGINKH